MDSEPPRSGYGKAKRALPWAAGGLGGTGIVGVILYQLVTGELQLVPSIDKLEPVIERVAVKATDRISTDVKELSSQMTILNATLKAQQMISTQQYEALKERIDRVEGFSAAAAAPVVRVSRRARQMARKPELLQRQLADEPPVAPAAKDIR